MYNINDITDYVIINLTEEDEHSLINLKLQKLLYYIQAWCLGIYERSFFNGEFQAWAHGPVNTEIYDRFKSSKNLYSFITIDDVIKHDLDIKQEDIKFIDWILENYAPFSGIELEHMTHNEQPWIEARGNTPALSKCTNVITNASMISYYGKRWKSINK